MGKPVIAGADPWTINRMEAMWGTVPFYFTNEHDLKRDIRTLLDNPDVRAAHAENGHDHVRKYHDELPALERLAELYHEAVAIRRKPRIHGKAVSFHSPTRRSMTVDGQVVTFDRGIATVTDVAVVRLLTEFAVERPRFGVALADEELA